MRPDAINSRMAAQRNHSLSRRWSSGSGIRRWSVRGGKSAPRASAHFALLALAHFQPHQKTIAQHYGDGMAMKAIPAPSLILIPAQFGFGFLMILLHPVAAMRILNHPGQRHGGREVTPEILPLPVLAATRALAQQPAEMAGAIAIHRQQRSAKNFARHQPLAPWLQAMVCQAWSGGAVSTASARSTGLAGPRPRVTLKLART